MVKKIQWKKGREKNIDAEIVHGELERIRESGPLTPDAILAVAEAEDSVLHNCFCWDAEKNHREHLRWQARMLVSSIEVQIIRDDTTAISCRQYVTLKQDGVRSYEAIDVALQDGDLRQRVVADALSDVERTMRKYSTLTELSKLYGATMHEIDTLRSALLRAQPRTMELQPQ